MKHVPTMDCGDGITRADNGCTGKGPVAKTAAYTILQGDTGTMYTNSGAAGSVTLTLPASPKDGTQYDFFCIAAQTLVIAASGGAKINGSAANGNMSAAGSQALVGRLRVMAIGGNWFVSATGTFTTT